MQLVSDVEVNCRKTAKLNISAVLVVSNRLSNSLKDPIEIACPGAVTLLKLMDGYVQIQSM